MSIPSAVRRRRLRGDCSPGMRISAKPGWQGTALTRAISAARSRRSRVDHVIGDDARLLGIIADAAERPLAKRAGLRDAEMDPISWHNPRSLLLSSRRRPGPIPQAA